MVVVVVNVVEVVYVTAVVVNVVVGSGEPPPQAQHITFALNAGVS